MKDAHGFSITSMAISPDRRILVSGSADNTCRVVDLPLQFAPGKLFLYIYEYMIIIEDKTNTFFWGDV